MDITTIPRTLEWTKPYFEDESHKIAVAAAKTKNIAKLMHVSDTIASNVSQMYENWRSTTKPSVFMYKGDVYKGFYADTLSDANLRWAQQHLLISSGLYGLLRPCDEISQYRLEMKTQLKVGSKKNLYEFWGDKLALYADEMADGVICMLTSEEYGKPIRKYSKSRIVTPVFMDHKPNGTVGAVPIYSKMMRGVMARWIIDKRVDTPEGLVNFTGFDYHYDSSRSTPNAPVFIREIMTPLIF